ncbi:MAG: L-aspartate oxidase [Marmoricola sp.]|nr:L-aspartate oxidase [Marmoricola sp.]
MRTRHHWARRSEQLDPARDSHEISLHVSAYDFPWDNLQALSFALFRTYAVPSIGRLLDDTQEFTGRVQKRYDDTGLLLEEVQRHGLGSSRGRSAVRRINQMHAMYDISNDDFRYVLATFVVVPKRWIDDFGFRKMTPHEIAATTNYYLELGRHMNIKNLPEDFAGFERLLDDYEREHFAFDPGGRRVADSTLDLMTTFPPNSHAPTWLVKRFAFSLMDEPLLRAFHYPIPTRFERAFFLGAMRLRARLLSLFPARSEPKWVSAYGYYRTYPAGYEIDHLGTFPGGAGCPVHRATLEPGEAVS